MFDLCGWLGAQAGDAQPSAMTMVEQLSFGWRSTLMGGVLFPIIASALLLWVGAADRRAVRWLVALMLATLSSCIPFFIGFAGAYDIWPNLTFLPVDASLSFAPLLYLYVYSSFVDQPPGWRRWLLLPVALHLAYQFGAFTLIDGYQAKWAYTDRFHQPYVEPFVRVLSITLSLGCAVAIHRLYQSYSAWLPTTRADDDNYRPLWLRLFIWMWGAVGVLWIGITIMELSDSYNYRGRYWLIIASLLAVLLILLETLARSRTPFPKMPLTDEVDEQARQERKEHPNRSQDWPAIGRQLKERVESERWFLESDFSLAELAQRTGLNRSYASRALNEGLQQNFSEFVNTLRIDTARQLLADVDRPLLDVAFQSGFGSKASFNRVFRAAMLCTPSQYRKRVDSTG
ncbi:MAG: AraC family transcriptional regulator [Pseudomonadota bacterium]